VGDVAYGDVAYGEFEYGDGVGERRGRFVGGPPLRPLGDMALAGGDCWPYGEKLRCGGCSGGSEGCWCGGCTGWCWCAMAWERVDEVEVRERERVRGVEGGR
jgi:hypothetical protein